MQGGEPRYLKLEAGLLLLLSAVQLIGFALTVRPPDLGWWTLRVLAEVIVTGLAGWFLWRGNAWGFLLGVASGVYWLWAAGRVFHLLAPAASVYLVIGCVILAGLLMPRSVKWFRSAWRASSRPVPVG
jgi:hypothetical protein